MLKEIHRHIYITNSKHCVSLNYAIDSEFEVRNISEYNSVIIVWLQKI